MKKLTVGSLFSGFGGGDLGMERAGCEIKWQVEIEPYAIRVLEKHWPNVPRVKDIREAGKHNLDRVDIIIGGFPCQDTSVAGKRAGLEGERSGLWFEMARIIRELRPRYIVVENPTGLLAPIKRDKKIIRPAPIGSVLKELAFGGYDAEWQVLPAAAFGAPHLRERVFIVAYRQSTRSGGLSIFSRRSQQESAYIDRGCKDVPGAGHAYRDGRVVPDGGTAQGSGFEKAERSRYWIEPEMGPSIDAGIPRGWWGTEPGVGRMANGVPSRMERLRGLGNAQVPQCMQWIGERIIAYENNLP